MEQWTKLQVVGVPYITKFEQKDSEPAFTFWLSNFEELWCESIAKEDLLKRVSDENSSVAVENGVTDQLIAAIGSAESIAQAAVTPQDDGMQFTYFTEGEILVKLRWSLSKCESQLFFDQITKPLLHEIWELRDQKKQLIDIVKRKDEVVQQHKIEGAKDLMRTRFITEPFNVDEFKAKAQMSKCEVGELESLIGPQPKTIVEPEEEKVETNNTAKPAVTKTQISARGRRLPGPQPYVKPALFMKVTVKSDN